MFAGFPITFQFIRPLQFAYIMRRNYTRRTIKTTAQIHARIIRIRSNVLMHLLLPTREKNRLRHTDEFENDHSVAHYQQNNVSVEKDPFQKAAQSP